MTVKELITELQRCNQDAEVFGYSCKDSDRAPINLVDEWGDYAFVDLNIDDEVLDAD